MYNSITDNGGHGVFLTFFKDIKNYVSIGLRNKILYNNIFNNNESANFKLNYFTKWSQNYWGEDIQKPYVIHGNFTKQNYPWINVDWNPVQEPYELSGGTI
jgi:hypothetical protein